MRRIKHKHQLLIWLIEYELFGATKWWKESLSKKEARQVRAMLLESGCKVKVHFLSMANPQLFVTPMERLPKVKRNTKKFRKQ